MKRSARVKALTSEQILKEISSIITEYLPGSLIYLFGSRAKGDAESTSDFDIAIDAAEKIPLDIIARIRDEIEELNTLKNVDIIDLNRVNTKLREIIQRTGVKINDRDKSSA